MEQTSQNQQFLSARIAAIAEWRAALGDDGVKAYADGSMFFQRRTFGSDVPIAATLFPKTVDAVRQSLIIAARYKIGVHPVSRGSNWGLGSRCPTQDGSVIMDLSGMNAISGFDAVQGRVYIEPGVSFIQLFTYLNEHTNDYYLPTIGGPVTASVLANALDRGDATLCERWASLSDMDVVLSDGRYVHTGHEMESKLAGCGVAPAGGLIEGLFSQSNLGVVVGGWLQLMPVQDSISAHLFHIGECCNLSVFIDRWRELQRGGMILPRAFTLWNGIKFLARQGARSDYSLSTVANAQLNDWYCSGFTVAETTSVLALRDSMLDEQLTPLSQKHDCMPVRRAGQWCEHGKDFFSTPRQVNLKSVYWRQHVLPDEMNPDYDGCGLLWLCIALPFESQAIIEFATNCYSLLSEAGMDLNFGLEASDFRVVLAYITLSYNRDEEGADENALSVYSAIMEMVLDSGYAPYRLANGAPIPERISNSTRNDLLRNIRHTMDPAGIISNGRAGV